MVRKDVLRDLFVKKIKSSLQKAGIDDEKVGFYVSRISDWFLDFEKNEIDKDSFLSFLDFFEAETLKFTKVLNKNVLGEVFDKLSSFLDEIEIHSSDEVLDKIERVKKKFTKSKPSYVGANNFIITLKQLFVVIVIIAIFSLLFMFFRDGFVSDSSFNQVDQNSIIQDLNDTVLNETLNSTISEDLGVIFDNNVSSYELSDIENDVVALINKQRGVYYLPELEVDLNFSKMLKENKSDDIASFLGIEKFVSQTNEELSLKGDNISLAIYNQMNKRVLFEERFSKIAISIEELKYKIYRVSVATY